MKQILKVAEKAWILLGLFLQLPNLLHNVKLETWFHCTKLYLIRQSIEKLSLGGLPSSRSASSDKSSASEQTQDGKIAEACSWLFRAWSSTF